MCVAIDWLMSLWWICYLKEAKSSKIQIAMAFPFYNSYINPATTYYTKDFSSHVDCDLKIFWHRSLLRVLRYVCIFLLLLLLLVSSFNLSKKSSSAYKKILFGHLGGCSKVLLSDLFSWRIHLKMAFSLYSVQLHFSESYLETFLLKICNGPQDLFLCMRSCF